MLYIKSLMHDSPLLPVCASILAVKLDVHFCGFRTLFFCGGGSFVMGHISLIF
jgi:hypothetical protein